MCDKRQPATCAQWVEPASERRCEQIRHRLPNLLAVNFYKEGHLFRVVNRLNGVG